MFSLCPPFSWWLVLSFYLISWASCFAIQEAWQQWIPKGQNTSAKGLLGFPGIIKNRKKIKSCAQIETKGHVVKEMSHTKGFSELGPVVYSLLPGQSGWGSDLDICVVLSEETLALDDEPSHELERVGRCTFLIWDEVQLWRTLSSGCPQGLQFLFGCCTIHGFAPQSSCPPCQGVHHARPCSSFKSPEGHCPYLLWQGVFMAVCAAPGLTAT